MKGTLKNEDGKWVVEYNEGQNYTNINVNAIFQLPLNPECIEKVKEAYPFWKEEGDEIEFEIVSGQRISSVLKGRNTQHELQDYAKLITSPKQEESKVTRLEVIDHTPTGTGRAFVKYNIKELELSYQDDNRTLKVFIK